MSTRAVGILLVIFSSLIALAYSLAFRKLRKSLPAKPVFPLEPPRRLGTRRRWSPLHY